jgi:hypothetical protein
MWYVDLFSRQQQKEHLTYNRYGTRLVATIPQKWKWYKYFIFNDIIKQNILQKTGAGVAQSV